MWSHDIYPQDMDLNQIDNFTQTWTKVPDQAFITRDLSLCDSLCQNFPKLDVEADLDFCNLDIPSDVNANVNNYFRFETTSPFALQQDSNDVFETIPREVRQPMLYHNLHETNSEIPFSEVENYDHKMQPICSLKDE